MQEERTKLEIQNAEKLAEKKEEIQELKDRIQRYENLINENKE